ncbi:MAG: guanylate cyclase [Alphaproteobacteria bacterium PA4]|nr:MAG: guanylate cyclase [Alphaproteobacteria bacterium PA4]
MKGIVFTELMGFLESQLGVVTADRIVGAAALPNDGAFTSVGNYPAGYALKIVEAAAAETGLPFERLLQDYGSYLYTSLVVLFPAIISHYRTAEDMLCHVASHIHEEVVILYPDARPPSITATADGDRLHVLYESHRPLAHLCFGLLRQCLVHFSDPRAITWQDGGSLHRARFVLAPALKAAA